MAHKTTRPSIGKNKLTWLLVGAFAITALAGCLQPMTDDPATEAGDPAAVFEVDREERWTGEVFTFDGRNSSAGEGEITHWTFDFGDGIQKEGRNISEAHVQHEYKRGGAYGVVFTVYVDMHTDKDAERDDDDAATDASDDERERATASATKTVIVNERKDLREQMLVAQPIEGAESVFNETARHQQAFVIYENATNWEVDVHLQATGLLGSEVTVRVMGAENQTLAEDNVTLEADEDWTLRLDGTVEEPGTHRIEIIAESGSIRADGTIRVYYEAPEDAQDA